jgi:hypothetical protein
MGLNPKPFLRSGPTQGLYHRAINLKESTMGQTSFFHTRWTYILTSFPFMTLLKHNYKVQLPHVVILWTHCFINNNISIQKKNWLKLEKYCFCVSHECIFKHKFYVHLFFPSPFFPQLANMVAKHFWPVYYTYEKPKHPT